MLPQEFVKNWRGNTSTERQSYQQHFIDLCHLVGHQTPKQLDPESKFFTFEAGASKQDGGQGWADVWYRGKFAIEYKGPHGDLDKAYTQLLQYRESLENPPLLIVSNTQELIVHTNFTGTAKQKITITLNDLLTPDGLQKLRNIFYNPDAFKPEKTAAQVTEEAAAQFGRLAAHLEKWGNNPHDVAHYLIRLLFCMFAEDIRLLPKELFTRLVDNGQRDNKRFHRQVKQLFHAMSYGDDFGEYSISWFDGGLFDSDEAVEMDSDGLAILHRITNLDWASIEPAIFGTLFTRSLDPSQRAKLGAQYTSKEDILLVVEPVLMAPLRREWAEVKEKARELAQRRDTAPNRAVKARLQNELSSLIIGFAQKLASIKVLDPACGSGNFLYVSLQLLLDLWKEVAMFAGEVGLSILLPLPGISPSPLQLYGIELNDYAHELAQATVWIGYLQWLHSNGFGFPEQPILKPLDNIKHMDAILKYEDGTAAEPEWPEADVIVGNPPFLGDKKMISELGERYVETIRSLYSPRVAGGADLVTYWFERAREQIEHGNAHRAGLLATQSIRFGLNRRTLERIKTTGDIFFAESDRAWILEGAAVRVAMVGFDNGTETTKTLDGESVKEIYADLSSAIDVTVAKPLAENDHLSFIGTQKSGPFEINASEAQEMKTATNANGLPNADVIKKWINADAITSRNPDMWIIDFGTNMPLSKAEKYQRPFSHVKRNVKPLRDVVRRKNHREKWWIFGESRPGMRSAISGLHRFIVSPRVAKYRLFAWASSDVVPDSRLVVIARDDDYFFGVLHSSIHEVWTLAKSSWHGVGNDPTYNSESCFETFPFPWPPGKEPQDAPRVEAIALAAAELVQLRDDWLNPPGLSEQDLQRRTLTNLYNQRPPWLATAHQTLDAAVFDAYGWPHDLADEEILARLLALNLERAGKK
ncbi:MAG: type IIL restriction-modification enzyme MmeI [Caldilineaceae bacterium]